MSEKPMPSLVPNLSAAFYPFGAYFPYSDHLYGISRTAMENEIRRVIITSGIEDYKFLAGDFQVEIGFKTKDDLDIFHSFFEDCIGQFSAFDNAPPYITISCQ